MEQKNGQSVYEVMTKYAGEVICLLYTSDAADE